MVCYKWKGGTWTLVMEPRGIVPVLGRPGMPCEDIWKGWMKCGHCSSRGIARDIRVHRRSVIFKPFLQAQSVSDQTLSMKPLRTEPLWLAWGWRGPGSRLLSLHPSFCATQVIILQMGGLKLENRVFFPPCSSTSRHIGIAAGNKVTPMVGLAIGVDLICT